MNHLFGLLISYIFKQNLKIQQDGLVYEKQMVDLVRNRRLPCVSNFYEYLLF
jgi:hypothetical protein